MTFPTHWFEGAVLVVLGVLTALAIAEAGLRIWAHVNAGFADRLKQYDLLAIQIEPMGRDGYRQRPNAVFHYWTGSVITCNALGYRGPVVWIPKPPGTLRVVLAGGSATYGWGVNDTETIDAYLRQRLAVRYPAQRIEVVNLAFDGYDSYQVYERIRVDGLRFEPDLIIVNAGINDVRNARFPDLQDPDPRTLLWLSVIQELRAQEARGRPAFKTWLKHHFYVARFGVLVREAFGKPPVLEDRQSTPFRPNWGAVDYFERNLRRTAQLAADHGAALLLSPEPSGIPGNFAPDAVSPRNYWITNAGLTQQIRDSLAARMGVVAADLREQGRRVALVSHRLGPGMFIDEAHLKPAGNEAMAADFEAAIVAVLGDARSSENTANRPASR